MARPGDVAALEGRVLMSAYHVTNANDHGGGSLRQAITDANGHAGHDTIDFSIGTGLQPIHLTAALPTVSDEVSIDATTQPGFAAAPLIVLDGSGAGAGADGLRISAGKTLVKGLIIDNFAGDGIELDTLGTNTIVGNYIGVDATGNAAAGNHGAGVRLSNSPSNAIGSFSDTGPNPNRNVISGNGLDGVVIAGGTATGNLVLGNVIGLGADGDTVLKNGGNGVIVGTPGNTIGLGLPRGGNLISGNAGFGVELLLAAAGNLVSADLIGTDSTGLLARGNSLGGVALRYGAANNTIGGTIAAARNVISGNFKNGVILDGSGGGMTGNLVEGNYIGPTGSITALPYVLGNEGADIFLLEGAHDNIIGGTATGAGNVIEGEFHGLLIEDAATTSNQVLGNLIGTTTDGNHSLGGLVDGVRINNATGNTIGGTAAGAGNVIAACQIGLFLTGSATGNLVQGNFLGTNAAGTANLSNSRGLFIASPQNTIGGTAAGAGNVVALSVQEGIFVGNNPAMVTGNLIEGNFIGTNAAGVALGNLDLGVVLSASGTTLGGTAAGAGNIIAFNQGNGIVIFPGSGGSNLIEGNFIGTNAAGATGLGNRQDGLRIGSTDLGNTIGGTAAGAGNVIVNNTGDGVYMESGASGNLVQGNLIGTDPRDTKGLGNNNGVDIFESAGNTIGGTAPGAGNLISGNAGNGIAVRGPDASGNVLQGNLIGTTGDGQGPLGNTLNGVILLAPGNILGGTMPGARNVIAANQRPGVLIGTPDATGNLVQGNYIGTDAMGASPLGNAETGIRIDDGSDNTIGGTANGAGNVISGNHEAGVEIAGGTGNLVQGNLIGLAADGQAALGNDEDGVAIGDAPANTIGGTVPGAGNRIAFNGLAGVFVDVPDGDAILGNAIFSNTQLGIDLFPIGVAPSGFPILNSATIQGSLATIRGSFHGSPATTYRLEFFTSIVGDPSGFGEGEQFLDALDVTTDGGGDAIFIAHPGASLPAGRIVTATATDPAGNTSEFSKGITSRAFAPGDYDGDGKTDLALFDQSVGTYYVATPTGAQVRNFGNGPARLVSVSGDYDGDGKTDLAAYSLAYGVYYIAYSGGKPGLAMSFGNTTDSMIPVAGDYDGDGKTDLALFDTTVGTFFVAPSGGGQPLAHNFGNGAARLIPVAGDYDGDGKTDLAAYSLAYGAYYILPSGGAPGRAEPFGNTTDVMIPIAADFDGDGRADLAVFDQSIGVYFVATPTGSQTLQFGNGAARLVPTAGDYDGDGKTDLAAYALAYGVYYVAPSGGHGFATAFGNTTDVMIPEPGTYVPPNLRIPGAAVAAEMFSGASEKSAVDPSQGGSSRGRLEEYALTAVVDSIVVPVSRARPADLAPITRPSGID